MNVRLDTNFVDYAILAIYFVAVLGMANKEEHEDPSERAWHRRPMTLAFGALGLTTILSVLFARCPSPSAPTIP